jgi:hypothetical protein
MFSQINDLKKMIFSSNNASRYNEHRMESKTKFMKSRKTISLILLFLIVMGTCYAQVGLGTSNPHPSAIFEVAGTNKGFLPPRMTLQQRNQMASPEPGLFIYCSDCCADGAISVYQTNGWESLKPCPDIDLDNDGVRNITDIDDDNDGIPDSLEQEFLINRNLDDGVNGWDVTGNVEVINGVFEFSNFDNPPNGVISQTKPIIEGESGIISFDYRSNSNGGSPVGCDIKANGVTVGTVSSISSTYQTFTDTIHGLTSPLTISFEDNTPNTNGKDLYLDNFSFKTIVDTDGDGLADYQDLDSDNDGCSDAFEGGATSNTSPNYRFPAIDVGANGLSDILETTTDNGEINYHFANDFMKNNTTCFSIDSDGDGIPYDIDIDDDNDGVLDDVERQFILHPNGWEMHGNSSIYQGDITMSSPFTAPNGRAIQTYRIKDNSDVYIRFWYRRHGSNKTVRFRLYLNDVAITQQQTNSDSWQIYETTVPNQTSPLKFELRNFTPDGVGVDLRFNFFTVRTDVDHDGDGILNTQDLDSDLDGCSDALEAGATTSTTPNFMFPVNSVGTNGLSNTLEDFPDNGVVNYSAINGFRNGYDFNVHSCN